MGYLIAAVIVGVLLLLGLVAVVFMPGDKRKNKDDHMPDGVTYNRPQGEGGEVEPKPEADADAKP